MRKLFIFAAGLFCVRLTRCCGPFDNKRDAVCRFTRSKLVTCIATSNVVGSKPTSNGARSSTF